MLEERLEGIEVSAFALVSDATVVPLAAARDYKRLGDGDTGPNTGGMGAFAPVPWFGSDALERTVAEVFEPIAWRMARDGTPYRGVLYAGLMLTDDGPMVLEFNARFGDPEAQVLLPLLDGELSRGTARHRDRRPRPDGGIGAAAIEGAAVGVVVAVGGLSGGAGHRAAPRGRRAVRARPTTATCSSSTPGRDGASGGPFETSGGRVVTIVGRGPTLADARAAAYRAVEEVRLEGGRYRTDVGELHVDDRTDLRDEAG